MINILKVPRSIRDRILSAYLKQCSHLHIVAFYQWRLKFPNENTFDKEQLESLIEGKMNYLYKNIQEDKYPMYNTMLEATISATMPTDYPDFYVGESGPTPHTINSFMQIGWPDPFIGEVGDVEFDPPQSIEDNVYMGSRYTPGQSPRTLYIPSKLMMLKMMRACVEVKTPD